MLIKGIYLNKEILLKKTKDFFEILSAQAKEDKSITVIPPKDAIVIDSKDIPILGDTTIIEIGGYKILTNKPTSELIENQEYDLWVFALLRALEVMNYDDIYVVFEEDENYILCYVKDNRLIYYEVFFEKDEIVKKLEHIEKDVLIDANIELKSLPHVYIKKGYLLAFGGALKAVMKNHYQTTTFSYQKLKKELINIVLISFSILLGYMVFSFSVYKESKDIKQKEKELFEQTFPNTPIVDIKEQVEALISPKDNFRLSKLLLKAYKNIPPDAKIYELFYNNKNLEVKSELNSALVPYLKHITYSKALPNDKEEVIQTWTLGR